MFQIKRLRCLDTCGSCVHSRARNDSPRAALNGIWQALRKALSQTGDLFFSSIARTTFCLVFINFTIAYGYYGLFLWFPELFNKLEQYRIDFPNDEKAVCDVVNFQSSQNSTLTTPENPCLHPGVNTEALLNTLITSIAPLPANLWTIVHMDKLGRKFFLGKSSLVLV